MLTGQLIFWHRVSPLADPAWERWSADEAAYAYDFETTSARKFVREGYYGHNGRLREIAKRWR